MLEGIREDAIDTDAPLLPAQLPGGKELDHASMLDITNLHATVADKPILNGITLHVPRGRGACDHGPERVGQVDARLTCWRAGRAMR